MTNLNRRVFLKELAGMAALPLALGVVPTARGAATAQKWQRVCSTCRGDARFGEKRNTYKEANEDVKAHLKKYPGHDTGVLTVD